MKSWVKVDAPERNFQFLVREHTTAKDPKNAFPSSEGIVKTVELTADRATTLHKFSLLLRTRSYPSKHINRNMQNQDEIPQRVDLKFRCLLNNFLQLQQLIISESALDFTTCNKHDSMLFSGHYPLASSTHHTLNIPELLQYYFRPLHILVSQVS